MIYLLHVRDNLSVETVKERLTIEGGERLMSIAEKIRNEGMKEEKIKVAKKLLLLKIDEEQIKEATELTAREIEQIKKDL